LGVVALGRLAVGTVEAARARTAADAAALAGAMDGHAAAAASAASNDGELLSFVTVGDDVVVRVRVGAASALARATMVLGPRPP
jgi:hypothetical protein